MALHPNLQPIDQPDVARNLLTGSLGRMMELEAENGKETIYPGIQAASSSAGARPEAFNSPGGARLGPAREPATQRGATVWGLGRPTIGDHDRLAGDTLTVCAALLQAMR